MSALRHPGVKDTPVSHVWQETAKDTPRPGGRRRSVADPTLRARRAVLAIGLAGRLGFVSQNPQDDHNSFPAKGFVPFKPVRLALFRTIGRRVCHAYRLPGRLPESSILPKFGFVSHFWPRHPRPAIRNPKSAIRVSRPSFLLLQTSDFTLPSVGFVSQDRSRS